MADRDRRLTTVTGCTGSNTAVSNLLGASGRVEAPSKEEPFTHWSNVDSQPAQAHLQIHRSMNIARTPQSR